MSFSETIFLFVLALIVFGPKKLPEIARQIGKALNEFRRASNEFKAQIEHEISNLEVEKKIEKNPISTQATFASASAAPEGTEARTLAEATSGTAVGVEASADESSAEAFTSKGNTGSSEAPATLAASTDPAAEPATVPTEPLPTHEARIHEAPTHDAQTHEAVTSSTSQESHA